MVCAFRVCFFLREKAVQIVGLVAVHFAHVQALALEPRLARWTSTPYIADGLAFHAALQVGGNGWLVRAKSGRAPAAFSGNSGVQRSRASVSLLIQWNLGDFPKKSAGLKDARVYRSH